MKKKSHQKVKMVYDRNKKYFDLSEAKRFWKYLEPKNKNEYVEIRLTGISDVEDKTKKEIYYEISVFAKINKLRVRKNCIFFIKTFEELKKILEYQNGWFCYYTKICYSINNRFITKENNGILTGGYDSVPYFQKLFLDIESVEHDTIQNGTRYKELLLYYVKTIRVNLQNFGFQKSVLISSGSGYHLLFPIEEIETIAENKERYKQYVLKLHSWFKSEAFEIDKLYDATRVMGLPGSYNRKRESKVEIVEEISGDIFDLSKVLSFKTKKAKLKNKTFINNLPEITKSLEYNILLEEPPQGERNNVLIFALKLLLKANNIEDVSNFESELENIYGGRIDLTPTKGTENKEYSQGIIINYCKRNIDWVEKNSKILKLYQQYSKKNILIIEDGSLDKEVYS